MSNSFKRHTDDPPAGFRTPSPPHRFREAISPDSSYFSRQTPPAPEYEQITPERINGYEEEFGKLVKAAEDQRTNGYYHSNSSRSAQNVRRSHNHQETSWKSADIQHRSGLSLRHDERAREEAELLLNFTRTARFAVPKTPITLESIPPYRLVNCTSFTYTNSSSAELQPIPSLRGERKARPTTQNGFKSTWKDEVYTRSDSLRRASHGAYTSDKSHMPPPELRRGSESSKRPESIIDSDLALAISTAQSNQPLDSAESEQEKEEATLEANDEAEDTIATDNISNHASKAVPQPEEKSEQLSPTTAVSSASKKKEDIPSICALCNFARNTAENEADSDSTSWISCDGCRSWFHFACAGFKSEREVRAVDKFRCKNCKPIFGPTTYVRKSARAHTSIDYAGLNEGVIKTSDLDPEHHYVKDFKSGKKFTPETFARIRPELVTAKFFELGDGMKEPVIIPAALNPRPRSIPTADIPEDAEDFEEQAEKCEELHENSNLESWLPESFEFETVQDQGQDALDMVIPQDLTVRKVSELYGPDEKLEVIHVKSQNGEDKPWTLRRWADYYESTGEKVVRNVISLEVSQSKLGRLIRRPQIVRDLDLQDSVWPSELQAKGEYPKVQFYCLMSVADCYTDFHIDFGGSSVYYHILRGKKTFFFIPPTEKHLKQYEEWCNSPAQNWTFLGDQTNQCYRVDLTEGDTMLIPAGWIHAVWTPSDSLVIGGNFLTRLHFPLQIRVAQIEKATNVARKFRYPYFQKLLWYTAIRYMDEDPIPESVMDSLNNGRTFSRPAPSIEDYDAWGEHSPDLEEHYQARYYPRAELDGLPELCRYLLRSALIASGYITEGISSETRSAVKRSIPKGHNHGEAFETIKKFALWCAWKRGNETIPYWAYPDYVPEDATAEGTDKKLSTRARRKLDHEAASNAVKIAPDRQSTRPRSQPQTLLNEIMANQAAKATNMDTNGSMKRKLEDSLGSSPSTPKESKAKKARTSSTPRTGPGRKTACEACRKSRRACKHGQTQARGSSSDGSLLADTSMNSMTTPPEMSTIRRSISQYDGPLSPTGNQVKMENTGELMAIEGGYSHSPSTERIESTTKTPQKPGGRTKACKDCRKSKRRCVHDELGNEDPKKMAEAAIPRPAAKRKKLVHNDDFGLLDNEMSGGPSSMVYAQEATPYDTFETDTNREGQGGPDELMQQHPAAEEFDINQLIDPALLAEGVDSSINMAIAQSAEQALSMLATSPLSDSNIDPQLMAMHESQNIGSSLISPPDSTGNGREQSPSAVTQTRKSLTPPPTANGSSRHSSRPVKVASRFTPDSGTLRQPSLSSGGAISSRDSTSPTMSLPPNTTPLKRSKSRAQSDFEADEASLKLIREMQAQELGLRRRA